LPSDIFPEYILIRVNEFNKVALSPIEEWMSYLKNGKIKPDTKTLGLSEAREKLKYYSMSPKERHAYDEHLSTIMIQNDVLDSAKLEGSLEGHMEGLLEGRLEGEEKKNLENAKRMKALGVSFEVIKQVTGQKISNDF